AKPFTLLSFFNLKDQTFRFYFLASWVREREISRDLSANQARVFTVSEIETLEMLSC
ncbi:unnamed protein product, partial [Brassica rapa subsp. trilocularis]